MPAPDDDASFLDAEMRRLFTEFQAETEPLEELQESLNALRGRGEAAGGLVRAETLPNGALSSLHIDPRALRLGVEALAEAVLAAAGEAAADVTARMAGMLADGLPPVTDVAGRFTRDR
ncbi:hypothetical protein GCM10022224_033080 [Nonomuraea antimicrobica]|uniref:YbaB/EbfC DNA-binding family protein n=1 Tax=Nonomuraea antimicrobica TaxID=561173 RepID=A0ABP7BRR6_9ACTN